MLRILGFQCRSGLDVCKFSITRTFTLVGSFLFMFFSLSAYSESPAVSAGEDDLQEVFAIVDGHEITEKEFAGALKYGMKKRFYHGTVPKNQAAAFLREIGQELIDGYLLQREADARGISPDKAVVEEKVSRIEQRNQDNSEWQSNREQFLTLLKEQFNRESVLKLIEEQVKSVTDVEEPAIRKFYDDNPDKFTQPASERVSVILLKVPPSSSSDIWEGAKKQAEELQVKLQDGANFSELAKEFSDDVSAKLGGDMGFQHQGMLGEEPRKVIESMEIGEVAGPVFLLEGYALLKLTDRRPPVKTSFEKAKSRAEGLLKRELGELEWDRLLFKLRQGSEITTNEEYYQLKVLGLHE